MATIRTAIQVYDGMSPGLKAITNALNITISSFEAMQRASSNAIDTNSIQAARAELARVEVAFDDVEREIRAADEAQQKLNNEIKNGQTVADGLAKKFGKVVLTLAPIFGIGKMVKGGFDRLIGIDTGTAKLEALGYSGQAIDVIMSNAITAVTGTAFRMEEAVNTAASAVAAGVRPGQQLERYLSLTADAAAIAGTNMNEMGAIFNKVTTSGMIQAQELNQIADRGIPIFQMLADEMNVTAQEVRKLASEGQISSDIFLNAVESGFGGAAQTMGTASFQATMDNIGAAISRIGANFLNGAGEGTGFFNQIKPLMVDLLNTLRNFESRVVVIGEVFGRVFGFIYNTISTIAGFFIDNWSWISPIIWGIVAAFVAYNAVALITNGILAAQAIIAGIKATATATVAQHGLNAALYASPLTWYILLIIALIALFYAAVAAVNHFAGTSVSATGIIVGAFMVALAFIGNLFVGLWNLIVDVAASIWDVIATVAEFLANVFNDPIGSIVRLFAGMADAVLGILQGIAKAIDAIFGSNLAEAVSGWRSGLKGAVDDLVGEAKIQIPRLDTSSLYLDRFEYGKAWEYGYAAGEKFEESINLKNILGDASRTLDAYELGNQLDGIYSGVDSTALNTAAMKDSMDATEEELKYLRDIAEQEVINRFTTAEIRIDAPINANIASNMDLDGVVNYLEEKLYETMQVAAEGVYE